MALALVIWLVVMVARGGGDSSGADKAATSSTSTTVGSTESSAAKPPAGGEPPSSSVAPSSSAAPVAGTAAQCADQSLAVKVTVEQPTYKLGEQPVFGIVITNISSVPCSRDVGPALQLVSVFTLDGQRRLWSSTDCYPDGQPDVRTLNGGEQAAFAVTWSGNTSQPRCEGERVQVPSGPYSVVAQLGSVRSAAEPFNIA